MLEAAMFPQKYDGRGLPPEMNQSCGEGRGGGELRVHTEEAPWVGGGLAWPHLARRGERRGGVWRETVVGHCVREVEFLLLLLWHRCFAMEFSLANRLNGSWR